MNQYWVLNESGSFENEVPGGLECEAVVVMNGHTPIRDWRFRGIWNTKNIISEVVGADVLYEWIE